MKFRLGDIPMIFGKFAYKKVRTLDKKINEIKLGKNSRTDYGDMTDLVASIKQKGILEPLLLTPKDELIAGYRRLKAAKMLDMKSVPYRVLDINKAEIEEVRLIENIQRKDLNPIEEGSAFSEYIKKMKSTPEKLATSIGKTKQYIERRLALMGCSEEVKSALIKRKIAVGHAAVLGRLPKLKDQAKVLKKVIDNDYSVNDMAEAIGYSGVGSVDLSDALFNKKGCADCKFNGSEQTLLVETEAVKGKCMDASCFGKKTAEWKKDHTERLKKKGITVMDKKDAEKIKGAVEIGTWDEQEYNNAVKALEKKPDTFAVVWDTECGMPAKEIWRIKAKSAEKKTGKQQVDAEKTLELNAVERLKSRVDVHRRQLTQDAVIEGFNNKAHVNAIHGVCAYKLKTLLDSNVNRKVLMSRLVQPLKDDKSGMHYARIMLDFAVDTIDSMPDGCLNVLSGSMKVDLLKKFELTDEYLNFYTKAQLLSLAKEYKHRMKGLKKTEMVSELAKAWKDKKIPRQLPKAMRQ